MQYRYCSECGAKIDRQKKCPSCGAVVTKHDKA